MLCVEQVNACFRMAVNMSISGTYAPSLVTQGGYNCIRAILQKLPTIDQIA